MNRVGCVHKHSYWQGSKAQGAQGDYIMQISVIDAMTKAVQWSHLSMAVQPQWSQPCISDVAKGMNDVTFWFVAAFQMNERKMRLLGWMSVMQRKYDDNHELHPGCVLFGIQSRSRRRPFIVKSRKQGRLLLPPSVTLLEGSSMTIFIIRMIRPQKQDANHLWHVMKITTITCSYDKWQHVTNGKMANMCKHQCTAAMPMATTIDDKVTAIVKDYWYENRDDGNSVTMAPQRIERTIMQKDVISSWLICQNEHKDMISPRRHNEAGRFTMHLTRNTMVSTSVQQTTR